MADSEEAATVYGSRMFRVQGALMGRIGFGGVYYTILKVGTLGNGNGKYSGGCQNYGPFLGVLIIIRHLIFRVPKKGS